MVMGALGRKMWRTIWRTKAQFFAMAALVMLGTAVYVSMSTAYYNLDRTKEAFYRETRFADYYFQVVRAPAAVTAQIARVPGVAAVTGRVEEDVPAIKADGGRATVRIIGYPLPLAHDLNQLYLRSGRLFDTGPGVLLDPGFAEANGISPGGSLAVVAAGRKVRLNVVGTAISPEFVYVVPDGGALAPEPKTFGIVMMSENQAQNILNLAGQVNQVIIKLTPGADEQEVVRRVEGILRPYGNLTSYAQKNQLSNYLLNDELSMLLTLSRSLPLIFLIVAVVIQFILMGRIIKSERLQIGTMKALGFMNRRIMLHYAGYAVTVSLAGGMLGCLLGMYLASLFSRMYAHIFNLPAVIGGVNLVALLYGIMLSAVAGFLAGGIAARSIVAVNPAESMRPAPPKSGGRVFGEKWSWFWRRLTPAWRMTLRSCGRNRMRFGATIFGIAAAVGLLVMSLSSNDSMNYLISKYFYEEQRYEYLVTFSKPVPESSLLDIARLDGVVKAEPLLQIPVKLSYRGRSGNDVLVGLAPGGTMKRPLDAAGRPLPLSDDGVLLGRSTARKLGVEPGDRVEVKTMLPFGAPHHAVLDVTGIVDESISGEDYTSLALANRVLGENSLVSGVMLKEDPGKAASVERALDKMGNVSSIIDKKKEVANFRGLMAYYIEFDYIMFAFAVALGFFIVFNASLMGFSERRRELASMRVMGFKRREVAQLLGQENVLHALLGIVPGLPFGYLLSFLFNKSMSNDIYNVPLVISPETYLFSVLGGLAFVVAANHFAIRRLEQLNMVDVLKDQD